MTMVGGSREIITDMALKVILVNSKPTLVDKVNGKWQIECLPRYAGTTNAYFAFALAEEWYTLTVKKTFTVVGP